MSTRISLRSLIAGALITAAAGACALAAGGRAGLLFATFLALGVLLTRHAHRLAMRRADSGLIASPPRQAMLRPRGRKRREILQLQADLNRTLDQLADREHAIRELTRRLQEEETRARTVRQALERRLIEIDGAQRAERRAFGEERERHYQELARLRQSFDRQELELTAIEQLVVEGGVR